MSLALRIPNVTRQERLIVNFDHPQLEATTAYSVWKAPWACKVVRISYINPTGLAKHSSDNFKLAVSKTGSVAVATGFDTDADDGDDLDADTWADLTLSAVAGATNLAATDVLTATFTEEGTATLPAGRLEIEIVRV